MRETTCQLFGQFRVTRNFANDFWANVGLRVLMELLSSKHLFSIRYFNFTSKGFLAKLIFTVFYPVTAWIDQGKRLRQ